MKIRNTITRFVTMAIAVAAIAFIGSTGMPGHPSGAHAQVIMGDGSVRFLSSSIGYVYGETLRVSVVNAQEIVTGSGRVAGHVRVFDGQGNLLAQSEEVKLAAGQFHSFDFDRDALRVVGESGTGRQQVRAGVGALVSVGGANTWFNHAPVAMEIVDNQTGKTISAYPGFTGGVSVAAGDIN